MSSCKRPVCIVEVVLFLFIMLVTTRALGEGTERIGLPASVGEVLAGVALAVLISRLGSLSPGLAAVADGPEIKLVATIGIFALMLLAGIEMRPTEIAANSRGAFFVAFGGMIVPLLAGVALAWAFIPDSPQKSIQALFVGVALSTTAVPAVTRVLMELNLLHTRLGEVIISAAIFDDVFGLVLLAILIGVIGTGEVPDVLALSVLLLKVAGIFVVTILLGTHVYPHVSRRMGAMEATSLEFSVLIAAALAYAVLAEFLGLHWILGAFMAGLFFDQSRVGEICHEEVRKIVTGITAGVFGPMFFASIGLSVDLAAVWSIPGFLGLLVALAFFGKLVGAGVPARLIGFSRRDSVALGISMSARCGWPRRGVDRIRCRPVFAGDARRRCRSQSLFGGRPHGDLHHFARTAPAATPLAAWPDVVRPSPKLLLWVRGRRPSRPWDPQCRLPGRARNPYRVLH